MLRGRLASNTTKGAARLNRVDCWKDYFADMSAGLLERQTRQDEHLLHTGDASASTKAGLTRFKVVIVITRFPNLGLLRAVD